MIILYGIPTCDSVRKARKWLDNHGIKYTFSNFREEKPSTELLHSWVQQLDWEQLLNRRSTSWRQLPAAARENPDQHSAIDLMHGNPTLIKRPVIEIDGQLEVGFSEQRYRELLT